MLVFSALGQHPLKYPADAVEIRYAMSQAVVEYTLRVDTNNLSGYDVEININNAPKSFHVAMATHPEYDDRYWRFVENFTITSTGKNNFVREDSTLWKITTTAKKVTIKYRLHLPAANENQRAVWKPFLSPTGGMVGDIHSFMYLVEQPEATCYVTFQLPEEWHIATGLTSTNNSKIFYTANAKTLLDCPVIVGKFQSWNFLVRSIPHKIVYWQLPNATLFDTTLLLNNIKKIAEQTIALFDTIPYKNYTFLLQDGASAALEHSNSVTIGIPSETFERDKVDMNADIAHEYFHAWNLVALRPAQYSEVNYGAQEKAKGLWWSEGLSIFYTDLLLRRAKLPVYDSTRIVHLEKLIERYYFEPGNWKFSPENTSLESNAKPGGLGDYSVSVHLQGEVLGAMLDFIVRDATHGNKSIDEVMRKMFKRYSGAKGFHAKDIEQTIRDICGCDVHSFFQQFVFNATQLDFNRYLKLIGKQVNVTWKQAADDNGKPNIDYRMFINRWGKDSSFKIILTDPESCWGKAGLHTADKIISINNNPDINNRTFRNIQRSLSVGDKVEFMVEHNLKIKKIVVIVSGYNVPNAHITSLKNPTVKQQKLFNDWNNLK